MSDISEKELNLCQTEGYPIGGKE